MATKLPSTQFAGTSYTTTEADGPQFARTFVLRRKGWDHHMELLAGVGSDAAITAQVLDRAALHMRAGHCKHVTPLLHCRAVRS